MPALPIIADVFRVALLWRYAGVASAVNVIHIEKNAASSSDVFADLEASVDGGMWGNVFDGFSVVSIEITPLDGTTATEVFTPGTPADWDGGTGGQYIPGYSQLISLRTALRGRSHRGRVYLPALAESAQDGGNIVAALASTQTAWEAFMANLNTAGSSLVVASYTLATASSVTSLLAEGKAAVQRRRQERVAA